MRVGVHNATPRSFILGKETRYPLYRRLGGPQGWSGRMRKILPTSGFDSRTVQPVASPYTQPTFLAVFYISELKMFSKQLAVSI
jgi:hypothetical protein